MIFGVPKERMTGEFRVGLTPGGAAALVQRGHSVYIEKGAGAGAHFTDADYRSVGAEVAHSAEEVWGRADIVLKVKQVVKEELEFVHENLLIGGFLHLAMTPRDILESLIAAKVSALAYEVMEDETGHFPIIHPMSEICGRMLPQIAARYLECENGGRGVLLSGTVGIPSAEVVVLGAGAVGKHAAIAFAGIGSQVTVLDRDIKKLQELDTILSSRLNTMLANKYNIRKVLAYADVLIGAIHSPFELAEHIVTRQMIKLMRPRGVAIDVAIDEGGCFETSRPTTLFNPTYVVEGITHYCVPNMTSSVSRTASHSITNAILPYIIGITDAEDGLDSVFESCHAMKSGTCIRNGQVFHPRLEQILGVSGSGEGRPGE